MFHHSYRVAFFDTDAMGVVHHSNYVRIMEIARVAWMREIGMIAFHIPQGTNVLGVTKLNLSYLRPAVFEDEVDVLLEGRLVGASLQIRYALWLSRIGEFIALGETELVPLRANNLTPTRFSMEMRARLREMPWREQWPPSKEEAQSFGFAP